MVGFCACSCVAHVWLLTCSCFGLAFCSWFACGFCWCVARVLLELRLCFAIVLHMHWGCWALAFNACVLLVARLCATRELLAFCPVLPEFS